MSTNGPYRIKVTVEFDMWETASQGVFLESALEHAAAILRSEDEVGIIHVDGLPYGQ